MKIVFDKYIPFLAEAAGKHWSGVQIFPMKPEEINRQTVRDADVLVIRTRTRADANLLSGSQVKMVCTATIGFDHIDTVWCESQGIRWMSCPGCNAQAVCDYIEEALNEYFNYQLSTINYQLSIGIVGVGHVGSLVAKMAERKGLKVLLNDPPKHIGVSIDEIADNCDIVTFHVPLDTTTHHLCDTAFLNRCRRHALIINAARGGVVDEQALAGSGHPYILDTWENEPHLNPDVLQHAVLASMHIAGYSLEGKMNATQMCLDAIAAHFHLPPITRISASFGITTHGDTAPGWLARISAQLKEQPDQFELLRKNYILR